MGGGRVGPSSGGLPYNESLDKLRDGLSGENSVRLVVSVLLAAGLAWPMTGCGGDSTVSGTSGVGGGLILADTVTGTHFSLSVADGAAELTAIGSSGAATEPELMDTATGSLCSLRVTSGALTMITNSSATLGTQQIEFADTVTAKTYTLAVVRGALTLEQN
jgi:flagellin-like hook-associated protein FlgL